MKLLPCPATIPHGSNEWGLYVAVDLRISLGKGFSWDEKRSRGTPFDWFWVEDLLDEAQHAIEETTSRHPQRQTLARYLRSGTVGRRFREALDNSHVRLILGGHKMPGVYRLEQVEK
jgi:hypothetical protein